MLKKEFMSMPDEMAFDLCFPGLKEDFDKLSEKEAWKLTEMPYKLVFKDIAGYGENCNYCGRMRCGGCHVPFKEDITVDEILKNLKIDTNNTLYSDDRKVSGKEFQVEVIWHQEINPNMFNFMSSAVPFPDSKTENVQDDAKVQLTDCLKEFKQQETLDEENMWYCSTCKEHVQATKTLEIFKLPRIMIVSLKRFKSSKSKYGAMGFGGQKLDTLVDFPLEGLDMSQYVLSKAQRAKPLIYDLYAVSNHYGGVGGGHYTAYGKNSVTGQWYSFNDSSCQPA